MSAPPTRLGKYDIVRALGEGGMGVVYEAVDSVIERTVAIKTIRRGDLDADEASEHLARFLIEAKAAGKLNHPNIVGLYDHGNEDGLAYIVMELVQGRELQHWFNDGLVFELPDVLRLMGELLDALGYSHRRGVVHRDVKPANIFITETGHVKLGDFGIARIESSQKTRIGAVLGTPSHMAPEQIRGEAADARSDLYAAGVVLFQFLTNQRPFAGTMLTMALKVLNEPAPAPSSLRPDLPRALDAVVAKALAKQPADRYQHAAEFWQALAGAFGVVVTPAPGWRTPSAHGQAPGEPTPSGFGVSGFGMSGFGTSHFGLDSPGPGPGSVGPGDARTGSTEGLHTPPPTSVRGPTPTPSPTRTRSPGAGTETLAAGPGRAPPDTGAPGRHALSATTWVLLGAGALVAAVAGWWLLRPARPTPSATPLPIPAASAPLEVSVPASLPVRAVPATPPASPATPTTPASQAPATEPAAPRASPAPAPTVPIRVRRDPPAPTPKPPPAAIDPPKPKASRPARCSDILQKASLEPLTGDEAAFLRRECQ